MQVKNADAIKLLDAQAQGEALLRKALAELKMWGLQREFVLTDTAQQAAAQGNTVRKPLLLACGLGLCTCEL